MSFFSRIDTSKTIQNARLMLTDYKTYKQMSKKIDFPGLQSPAITGMPSNHSISNSNEDKMISYISRQENAKMYCSICIKTIEALESDVYKTILTDTYIRPVSLNSVIWDKLGYGQRRYYELKNEALLAFSEVCPGRPVMDREGIYHYQPVLVYKFNEKETI